MKLRRELSGDLENIVTMAMRKEPDRRYSSVAQLANDVERYLTACRCWHAPIRGTIAPRSSSVAHTLSVGLSAAFVAMLLGFT